MSLVGKAAAIPDTWTQILSDFMINKCGYFGTRVLFPRRDPDKHREVKAIQSPLNYTFLCHKASFGHFRL